MPDKNPNNKSSRSSIEKITSKTLASEILEMAQDPRQFAWRSFRAGIYRGMGFTLGTIIILILVSALVTVVGAWPYIGDFFKHIQDYLSK